MSGQMLSESLVRVDYNYPSHARSSLGASQKLAMSMYVMQDLYMCFRTPGRKDSLAFNQNFSDVFSGHHCSVLGNQHAICYPSTVQSSLSTLRRLPSLLFDIHRCRCHYVH